MYLSTDAAKRYIFYSSIKFQKLTIQLFYQTYDPLIYFELSIIILIYHMQYNICISMQGILILIFQKSGIKVSRNNCFIFCSKKRDESTIEEDRTIYISNCSARENQLICVTMLRKLPWKRTGCTMGCCIGRQALSRVSLFHPTDMSNAGCISIYAPSQNSPRRGRASFSLPFSPPFSYSRRLVDVRRGISFRYHVCSYDSRCNVPATQVNRFCRFSEWKYFFEEVGFVAWNNFIIQKSQNNFNC